MSTVGLTSSALTLPAELYVYLGEPPELGAVALGDDILVIASPGWRVRTTGVRSLRYYVRWKPDPEVPLVRGTYAAQGEFWKASPAIRVLHCLSRGQMVAIPVQTRNPRK